MNKHKYMITASVVALAAGLVGGAADAQQVLRLGHVYDPAHPMHLAAVEAAESFAACTGGSHTIEVFPASQLGSENALNEQIRFGGVDIILTGQIFASSSYPPLAIGAAPYIFANRDQALSYRTSDIFEGLWEGWNAATGQHILSAGYFGSFNVTSNSPIVTPADMVGMRVRVPDSPIYMAFPKAVGANPTPVAFAEVYLALQQGLVTGSVNPLPTTNSMRFYEVQDYVALTGHLVEYVLWIVGDHVWSGMSADARSCMADAAAAFGDTTTAAIVEQEDTLRVSMEAEGKLQFTEPDIAAFQAATSDAINAMAEELGVSAELLAAIQGL
jgi:tripartite ATP-independent transporter DctP family solute receptor